MKQLKTRALLLSLVAILFAASTADTFAQLTKIWEIKNFSASVEALSPNGKLGHLGGYLIDLTNGNIIDTKVSPERFHLTYSGDRYFVSNWQEKTMKVYDRYTKEFIQDLDYNYIWEGSITAPDDSIIFEFERNTHSLQFRNIYTNELIDSYKIPGTPDFWTYDVDVKPSFSHDGRYFGFTFKAISGATAFNFMVYDREAREIVFFQTLPISQYSFVYSFMHTSNQLAYGEVVKLEGDDKPYSYIRIFDLDKRKVIRNVRVGEESNYVRAIVCRNDDKFILYRVSGSNETRFYDTHNQQISDYSILIAHPILAFESTIVNINMQGYSFDWTVGIEDINPTGGDSILYPNPTTNSINLEINESYFNGFWEITDLNGTKLMKGIIQPIPLLQINIEALPPQTYMLRLQMGSNTITYKVQKI